MSDLQQTDAATTAEATLAATLALQGLERKRKSLVESRAADDAERRAVAFRAYSDGDKSARQVLDKLNAAAVRFDSELRSIEDAIAVAQDRVQAARAQEAEQAAKANALAIRECCAEFLESALSLNEAILALSEEGAALQAAVRKLRALGVGFPTDQQISVLGLQCLQTGLMETAWRKEFLHLAPKDRRRWSTLAREWVARIELTCVQPHLGEASAATIPDDLSIPVSLRRELPPAEVQQ